MNPNSSGAWLPAGMVLAASLRCLEEIEVWRAQLRQDEADRLLASRWHPFIRTQAKAMAKVEAMEVAKYSYSEMRTVAWRLQALARQLREVEDVYVTSYDYQQIHRQYERLSTEPDPSEPAQGALAA